MNLPSCVDVSDSGCFSQGAAGHRHVRKLDRLAEKPLPTAIVLSTTLQSFSASPTALPTCQLPFFALVLTVVDDDVAICGAQ